MKKVLALLISALLALLVILPPRTAHASSYRHTDWTVSADFGTVRIGGKDYENITFFNTINESLWMTNMGAIYLIDPQQQSAWTPEYNFSTEVPRMMRNYIKDAGRDWPVEETVLINGVPWQETAWRDMILTAIIEAHPDQRAKIEAFYADSSNNGYAVYVFQQGMALEQAKREHPLEKRTVNGPAFYFYRSWDDFVKDGGVYPSPQVQRQTSRNDFTSFLANLQAGIVPSEAGPVTITLYIDDPVIHVTRDGKTEDITLDVAAWCPTDVTFVPVRGIFEAMGASVNWEGATQTVQIYKGNTVMFLRINDSNATIGNERYALRQPPLLRNSRTLVPLRFISENLGYHVEWRPEEPKKIVISDN